MQPNNAAKPDLDRPEQIALFLQSFYDKLLHDAVLAPIFIDVAGIDITTHLGHIQAYWEKLLLGADDYHRHTMNIHRALHTKRTLTVEDFDRWYRFFSSTIDEKFTGPVAERAKHVAQHIVDNMKRHIVGADVPERSC